jgi:hypothetical protein
MIPLPHVALEPGGIHRGNIELLDSRVGCSTLHLEPITYVKHPGSIYELRSLL